jgi:hypothetical protein
MPRPPAPSPQSTRRALQYLTDAVTAHLDALDEVMREPSGAARAEALVQLACALDIANTVALRTGLGLSVEQIAKRVARD